MSLNHQYRSINFFNCLLNFIDFDSGEIQILNTSNQNHNFLRRNTAFISIDKQQHIEKSNIDRIF